MHTLWTTFFYKPLYNALIFLVSVVPFNDIAISVVLLTIIVKSILYPLTKKSLKSQIGLQKVQKEVEEIKSTTEDKQEQAKKTFELYKKYGVNPFSGCIVILIQFPIIIALYYVFWKGFNGDTGLLYSFVKYPESLHTLFLGFIDMTKPNIIIGIIAAITQFLQLHLSQSITKTEKPKDSMGNMSYMMQQQMKYVVPFMILLVSFKLPSAVALYWIVGNIIAILQERYIRKGLVKAEE